MGNALIKYKIMPEGMPEDFEILKELVKKTLEDNEAKVLNIEEQPIAFGLKSIIATISIDESKDTNQIEESLKSLEGISSLDVIDYRRAIE